MRHSFLDGIVLALLCGLAGASHAQDAAAGARVFRSQCSICHSPQPGRNIIGPSLFGVGRPAFRGNRGFSLFLRQPSLRIGLESSHP
jgi:cytochrome c